jgi:hypothetical protein
MSRERLVKWTARALAVPCILPVSAACAGNDQRWHSVDASTGPNSVDHEPRRVASASRDVRAGQTAPSGRTEVSDLWQDKPMFNGPIDRESLADKLEAQDQKLHECAVAAHARDPGIEGRVTVRFMIGTDGQVGRAEYGGGDVPDAQLTECVIGVARSLRFPPLVTEPATVMWSVHFDRTIDPKTVEAEKMRGWPQALQPSVPLPSHLSRESIIAATSHPRPSAVWLVMAQPVPDTNQFLVLAGDYEVFVALVEQGNAGRLRTVARMREALVPELNLSAFSDCGPVLPTAGQIERRNPKLNVELNHAMSQLALASTQVDGFDVSLTALRATDKLVVGIHTSYFEAYAGGGGQWEFLTLLRRSGDRLEPWATVPLAGVRASGGASNADGSRDAEGCEVEYRLSVVASEGGSRAKLHVHPVRGPGKAFEVE